MNETESKGTMEERAGTKNIFSSPFFKFDGRILERAEGLNGDSLAVDSLRVVTVTVDLLIKLNRYRIDLFRLVSGRRRHRLHAL